MNDETMTAPGAADAAMTEPDEAQKTAAKWRSRIEASREYRETFLDNHWKENVNYRVQRPWGREFGDAASDRLASPEDWTRTKQKTAQLMYRVPKIVAKPGHEGLQPFSAHVTAYVNDLLQKDCKAHFPIDECLADVINAAGIAAVAVGMDERTEMKTIEEPGPPVLEGGMSVLGVQLAQPRMVPGPPVTREVKRPVYRRATLERISPANLLWPPEFKGSDWDKAAWLGYETYLSKADVKRMYGEGALSDLLQPTDDKDPDPGDEPELLSEDIDEDMPADMKECVRVTVIWARASEFDPGVVHPECLKRLVFIEGREAPVEDAKTDWQQWHDEEPPQPAPQPEAPAGGPLGLQAPSAPQMTPGRPAHYSGLRQFPIRVLTLTYVSDMAVPPSDSEAGRSQVRELIRGRSQMILQRDHSVPMRWVDVNRVDPVVLEGLKAGTWQDIIPMNGPGTQALGEVARATYPRESFDFYNVISGDLDRSWAMSANQLSSVNRGKKSATEVNEVATSNDERSQYEKDRVLRWVTGVAETLFQLSQRFLDAPRTVEIIGPDGAQALAQVDPAMLAGDYAFDFVPNSADRLDTTAQLDRAIKMYNLMANAPGFNRQALEREIIELAGFDPAKFIGPPPESGPEPPKITFSFGTEDMLNPMAVALILKSHQMTPKDIEAAAKMIQDAMAKVGNQQIPQEGVTPAEQAPAAGPDGQRIEPPQPADMITKRLGDGTRMM